MSVLSKSDMEILSQYIDDEHGCYRLRAGPRVYYLTISTDVFDDDTMCRPYLLIPRLPDLPNTPWTTMAISRDQDGSLASIISTDPLPEIRTTWHERRIDVLSLTRTRRIRSGVHEVQYDGAPAIAKMACFQWEIPRIEHETWAYSIITHHRSQHAHESPMAPSFLGHLIENGRTIGFLLEKVDGERARPDDLPRCEALLRRVHRLGLVHGDVNRYNFIVNRDAENSVYLVDFEHCTEFDEGLAREELLSLPAELAEETGRGTTVTLP
ncbi:hypothetical protein ACRALDRAFT_2060808 [Sodiomyces alcalophilus JCM 7366]|uniref:uncharacterized protein n=1 Tax=Sodiomyces alcalophilus JCM 7366 TaxID=591952 RepID=UPI0039B5F5EA